MPNDPRHLTKSRFKLALECPAKLYYTNKQEYVNKKLNDTFLQALAEGGFQVGELAKLYYPNGQNAEAPDHEECLRITNELLQQENIVIFEAAFRFENLYIRADIVIKEGNTLHLIEVKSKSYDPDTDSITTSKGSISSKWKSYIYDIAFQKYVATKSFPQFNVTAFLCLVDKSKNASIDGLNQMFLLSKSDGRTRVIVRKTENAADLGQKILIELNVDDIVNSILTSKILPDNFYDSFDNRIASYSKHYFNDTKMDAAITGQCKTCEFSATSNDIASGHKSGLHECLTTIAKFQEADFERPLLWDIWYFRKTNEFIQSGRYFMDQISAQDLESRSTKKQVPAGLSRVDRQALQLEKAVSGDHQQFIDTNGLRTEMDKWTFPLHFIDFETTAVAIPFNSGRRPYEPIAFQFSHHQVNKDGTIEHAGEWINTQAGIFPNFEFIRNLKSQLEKDEGTILRYGPYENSILNSIYTQLQNSTEKDKDILMEWIKTVTQSKADSAESWQGNRNMVDLLDLVKRYYYHPSTKGSNSLKDILPAVLNESNYLKEKYAQPIYGQTIGSLNYKKHSWIKLDEEGQVINPYALLPRIIDGYNNDTLDTIAVDDEGEISDGGAAMIAYAKMQFTEMTDKEREMISKALLRYCELDTFAMVMIWEAWTHWCK
ncbi:DUF2779 domain-containing protein [Chitinophaga agrisoli]|uniref:DUF2779 domain-containing protein n=1 Tax=Chitinophaga agrisoli TaxID=2607653 RepID=A0A5B2VIR3_9BACT|nr:DUF2779 domain-containing protein [Chitinophaga agrisoli]KAA2238815.1 DUF2779 domain-containing protein [Chitinophaga agrisoli]